MSTSPVCTLLPQELLKRTTLETQKLELMTEVSSLKLKLTAVERDHRDNEVPTRPYDVAEVELKFSAAPAAGCHVMRASGSRKPPGHCFKVTEAGLTPLEDSDVSRGSG